jgi:glutamine synthetase adenylyltransferase
VLANAAKHQKLLNISDNVGIYRVLENLSLIEKNEQQYLTTAYQRLRAIGHKAVMQNTGQLVANDDVDFVNKTSVIWHKYLC